LFLLFLPPFERESPDRLIHFNNKKKGTKKTCWERERNRQKSKTADWVSSEPKRKRRIIEIIKRGKIEKRAKMGEA
jgi:hypothetical protein